MKLCSPGIRARLDALGVGRVRMSRAVTLATLLKKSIEGLKVLIGREHF
jgi:hypothetical protein